MASPPMVLPGAAMSSVPLAALLVMESLRVTISWKAAPSSRVSAPGSADELLSAAHTPRTAMSGDAHWVQLRLDGPLQLRHPPSQGSQIPFAAYVPLGQLATHVPRSRRRTGRGEPDLQEVHAVWFGAGAAHERHEAWHRMHSRSTEDETSPTSGTSSSSGAKPVGHASKQPPTCLYGWLAAHAIPSLEPGPRQDVYCLGHLWHNSSRSRYVPTGHCVIQKPSYNATLVPRLGWHERHWYAHGPVQRRHDKSHDSHTPNSFRKVNCSETRRHARR